MSVLSFLKGIFLFSIFAVFIFSGGCAFLPAIDCLLFPRCHEFSWVFILPGTFIAFLTSSIFLAFIKNSNLSFRLVRNVFHLLGAAKLLSLGVLTFFIWKNLELTDKAMSEGLFIILIYLASLAFFAILTIKEGYRMIASDYNYYLN